MAVFQPSWPGLSPMPSILSTVKDVDARHKAGHDIERLSPRNISISIHPARALPFARLALLPIPLPVVGRADAIDRRRAGDAGGARGIKDHDRLFPFARLFDGLPQQLAISADRLVGGAEMLSGAILDRTHRLAGPLIVHVDVGAHAGISLVLLLLWIETVVVAFVLVRDVIGQLIEREALAPHLIFVDGR